MRIVDQLPPRSRTSASQTSAGTCTEPATPVGGTLICDVGDIDPDDPIAPFVEVVVTMHVPDDFLGGNVTNTAAANGSTPDPDPTSNISSYTSSTGPQADLSMSKSIGADPAVAGGRSRGPAGVQQRAIHGDCGR